MATQTEFAPRSCPIESGPLQPFDLESAPIQRGPNSACADAPRTPQLVPLCSEGAAAVIVLGGAFGFPGVVRDLSADGCRIATEVARTLERRTQVEIVMIVDRNHSRIVGGVRRDHQLHGVGLESMNFFPPLARSIRQLIVEFQAQEQNEAAGQCLSCARSRSTLSLSPAPLTEPTAATPAPQPTPARNLSMK